MHIEKEYSRGDGSRLHPIIAVLCTIAIGYMMISCGTSKTVETCEKVDSVASVSVSRNDSIIYKETSTDRLVDHYINNTYIVTPLGDTVGTKQYEKLIIKTDTKQTDSIRILQARCDSLTSRLSSKVVETKTVTTPLTLWQRIEIRLFPFVCFCFLICVIALLFRLRK